MYKRQTFNTSKSTGESRGTGTSRNTTTSFNTTTAYNTTTTYNTGRATGTSKSTTTAYATTTTYNTSKSTTTVYSTAASLTSFSSTSSSSSGFVCFEFLGNTYFGTNVSSGVPQQSSQVYALNNTNFPLSAGFYGALSASGFGPDTKYEIGAGGTVVSVSSCGGGFSDRSLKKDIKLIGISPNGLNIYSFRFKDDKYGKGLMQGVMADEVQHIPGAVIEWKGLKYVNYNEMDEIDVEFKKI